MYVKTASPKSKYLNQTFWSQYFEIYSFQFYFISSETTAALSIANLNELNEFNEDSMSRDTPTTKLTSHGTFSTDEWENVTDYPGTPRTVTRSVKLE